MRHLRYLILILMLGSIAFAANCGGATTCYCGDAVNESYTFTGNLLNSTNGTVCPNYGLTINASGITVDCAGYNMTGNGSRVLSSALVIRDVNNSEVRNCNIKGFGDAGGAAPSYYGSIHIYNATNTTLDNITLNTTENNAKGVYVHSSATGVLVNNSYITVAEENAIYLSGGGNNSFENSEIIGLDSSLEAIFLHGSDYNVFDNVNVSNPNLDAVAMEQSSGNHATNNVFNNSRIISNRFAFEILSPYNTIENSYVQGRSSAGNRGPLEMRDNIAGTIIRNNTINQSRTDAAGPAIHIQNGANITIFNNTIVTSATNQNSLSTALLQIVTSQGVNVTNNSLDGLPPSFYITVSSRSHLNHTFTNNTGDGKPVYFIGTDDSRTSVANKDAGQLWIAKHGFTAENITMQDSETAYVLFNTQNVTIRNLTVNETIGNLASVYLVRANNTELYDISIRRTSGNNINKYIYFDNTDNTYADGIDISYPTGSSYGNPVVFLASDNNTLRDINITTRSTAIAFQSLSRYNRIEDGTIHCEADNAITVNTGQYNNFTNITITGLRAFDMRNNAHGTIMRGCNIAVYSYTFGGTGLSTSTVTFRDNYIRHTSTSGYTMTTHGPMLILNNTFNRSAFNRIVQIQTSDVQVENNTFISSGSTSTNNIAFIFLTTNSNATIRGNNFTGAGVPKLYIDSPAGAAIIEDNHFGPTNGTSAYMMTAEAGSTSTIHTFVNNTFTGPEMNLDGFRFNMTNNTFRALDGTADIRYSSLDFNGSSSFVLGESNLFVKDKIAAVESNDSALDPAFNSSAVASLHNVDCDHFSINYNSSFVTTPAAMNASPVVATAADKGGSCDGGVCTGIACTGSTLSFTVPSWSSFSSFFNNTLPLAENVTLTSTSGNNLSSDNLTVSLDVYDENSDSVYNVTNWYLNDTSIMLLNMPFEATGGNESNWTKDYSNLSNHGNASGSVAWDADGGYDGHGAYNFTGGSIETPLVGTKEFTWMARFKLDNTLHNVRTIMSIHNPYLLLDTMGSSAYIWASDGLFSSDMGITGLQAGQWYHIAFVREGDSITGGYKAYLDGNFTGQENSGVYSTTDNIWIGRRDVDGQPFDGMIDDVRVYNRSLSPEQIKLIADNRSDVIASEETSAGDVWKACITPNDGYGDGNQSCSNNLTVLETPLPPTVVNLPASAVGEDTATLNCNLTSDGGSTAYGYILYGTSDAGNTTSGWNYTESLGNISVGPYSRTVSGLAPGTQYFYRCYANNTDGGSFGDPAVNFTTLAVYNISSCQALTSPGSYHLTADLSGANVSAGEVALISLACMKVASSDVTLDCDGHTITNNGTANAAGIVINGSGSVDYTNVNVRDCPSVSGYENGLYIHDSSDVTIEDSASVNSTSYGIFIYESDDSTVTGSTSADSSDHGIYVYESQGITLTDNTVSDSLARGIYVNGGSGHTFTGNTVTDSTQHGIYLYTTSSNTLANNVVSGNGLYGFYLQYANQTSMSGDAAYDNYYDLYTWGVAGLNMSNVQFRNPSGSTTEEYAELSIDDAIGSMERYAINWTTVTPPAPGIFVFPWSPVTITPLAGTVSIDTITWHWSESDSDHFYEEDFELWKQNSSGWSYESAVLDTDANTITVTALNPASNFSILQNSTNQSTLLYGANVTNVSHHPRYGGTGAGNLSIEGGNITSANANTSQLTERWAAFYGNVTGGIILSEGASTQYVYSWDWDPADGGVVCVSTNSSVSQFYALRAIGSDIDNAWSLASTATDSGNNTFSSTNCSLSIGTTSVTNTSYADTGPAGGFMTCAVKMDPLPAKAQMLFCSQIISGGTTWNNGTGDYEVMVPTPEGPATTETYYFYANLN